MISARAIAIAGAGRRRTRAGISRRRSRAGRRLRSTWTPRASLAGAVLLQRFGDDAWPTLHARVQRAVGIPEHHLESSLPRFAQLALRAARSGRGPETRRGPCSAAPAPSRDARQRRPAPSSIRRPRRGCRPACAQDSTPPSASMRARVPAAIHARRPRSDRVTSRKASSGGSERWQGIMPESSALRSARALPAVTNLYPQVRYAGRVPAAPQTDVKVADTCGKTSHDALYGSHPPGCKPGSHHHRPEGY